MQGKEKKRLIKRLEKKSASCMRSMPLDDHEGSDFLFSNFVFVKRGGRFLLEIYKIYNKIKILKKFN